jgi:hypothetical protein
MFNSNLRSHTQAKATTASPETVSVVRIIASITAQADPEHFSVHFYFLRLLSNTSTLTSTCFRDVSTHSSWSAKEMKQQ